MPRCLSEKEILNALYRLLCRPVYRLEDNIKTKFERNRLRCEVNSGSSR
jgi:hypothetical protein